MDTRLRDFLGSSGGAKAGDFIVQYGQEILIAAALFLAGLIAVKVFLAWLRKTLPRFTENQYLISTVITVLNILLIILVLSFTLHSLGMKGLVIWRLLAAIALVTIAFIVLLKPYIPTLPFKIGNTIEIGGLIGKVEAMTFTHTRMKTFDGKTLFIPNQMLYKTVVNNFHFTPTRRVRVKVIIGYKDDLLKAKQVLKEIMDGDPRVLKKPAPAVYVMELGDDGVNLSARCWVENAKYLRVLSDVTEKVKLRFDQEGISIPFPQRDVHLDGGLTGLPPQGVRTER
ncbi:MAG: mechanosensitive ion channel family protein [Deltaproteobacteria bacterium]|nr:mechanosensitive ion channel family protein [Deltaproteobacteria bacterium]